MVFQSLEQGPATPPVDLLSWALDSCPYDENRPIVVDAVNTNLSLSWLQVKNLVRQFAAGFKAKGLQPGECALFMCNADVSFYPMFWGCMAAGGIDCGAHRVSTIAEFKKYAHLVEASWFVVDPSNLEHALEAAASLSVDASRIIVFDPKSEADEYVTDLGTFATSNALLSYGFAEWKRFDDVTTSRETIGMRFFTSGTSGQSKAADISHFALIAHVNQWVHLFAADHDHVSALQYIHLQGVTGHGMVTTAIKLGFPIYILPFSVQGFLEACRRLSPTLVMLDPFTAQLLVRNLPEDSQDLKCFRDIRSPGATMPKEAQKKLQSLLHPDCLISKPYGLTEAGTMTALPPSRKLEHDPDSVGFTWPGVQIKLLDDQENEIFDYDRAGELCVKADTLFSGYRNSTAPATDEDGFYRTGDLGYISKKTQQWYLQGRRKEIFKVDGRQVAPMDIEAVLSSHPNIVDAAVVPIETGEGNNPLIKAFIVPREKDLLSSKEEIVAYSASKLATYMTITGGIEVVESVPRNALGKVMRWKLHPAMVKAA